MEYFYKNILTFIVIIDYSISPFVSMLIMNIAIFLRLRERDSQYNECTTLIVNGKHPTLQHSKGMCCKIGFVINEFLV